MAGWWTLRALRWLQRFWWQSSFWSPQRPSCRIMDFIKASCRRRGWVWESLHNVEGDGNFCDSDFRLCHPPQRSVSVTQPEDLTPQQPAAAETDRPGLPGGHVSAAAAGGAAPGPLSDLDLARRLQEEEYQQQQQQQQGGPVTPGPQHSSSLVDGSMDSCHGLVKRRSEFTYYERAQQVYILHHSGRLRRIAQSPSTLHSDSQEPGTDP
ncbi:hypothetical protein J4Q44_G00388190 [Coregonus suidteri]|uniref:Ubiquitin carboxyl-terminal hydrolase n=1 Tax=Coregonus suidteri TaxID=861788 RepID=A0AAN8KFN1_9TELE